MFKKLLFSTFLFSTFISVGQTVSISPANGNRGQALPIVISGNGTNFSNQGSGTTNIYLKQGSYTIGQGSQAGFSGINVIDPLTIAAHLNIPVAAPLGNYDLMVFSGSSHIRLNGFTVNSPSNAQISMVPNGSQPATTTSVQISVPGGSFKKMQTVENVWLSRGSEIIDDITNINVVNSTNLSMDINVPSGATNGLWNINIYTDAGNMYTTDNAFTIDNSFGIFEANKISLSIFPNPAADQLNFKGLQQLQGNLEFHFSDSKGNLQQIISSEAAEEVVLDISDLAGGLYLIQVYQNGILQNSSKILVQ